MNYRYVQIIATCLIAGTLTFALKKSAPTKKGSDHIKAVQTITEPRIAEPKKQPVTLKPNISSKDLSYQYGFVSYSPTTISLSINDEELTVNDSTPITLKPNKDGIITAQCEWTFPAGYKGKKVATWKVKANTKEHAVTFDWNKPEKLHIEDAELISIKG